MRTLLAIALVGAAASISHADERRPIPAAELVVRPVGAVVLESTSATVREVGDTALVELAIVVANRRDDAVGRIDLNLPDEARILSMSYTQGGDRAVASPLNAGDARRRFEQISGATDRMRDPALLELNPTVPDGRRYRLSVFPMSSFERTTVAVSIATPRFRELVITDHDRRWVVGAKSFSSSQTEADLALAAQTPVVNSYFSLYAAPEELPVAYPALRSVVAPTRNQMRACLGHHGRTRALDLVVKFTIDDDGATTSPQVIGGWRELNTCIAGVAQTWVFDRKLAGPIRYPLHLTP